MFPTSRIQYVGSYDRGAGSASDMPSECNTPPYQDKNRLDLFYRVPTMKRLCVKAFLQQGDDYVLQSKDALAIAKYIGASLDTSKVPGGLVAYVCKMFIGQPLSAIPEHDPGSTATGNEAPIDKNPKNQTQDPLTAFIAGLGNAATFLTNPMNWLAIVAMLIGLGILTIAIIKGLG